MILSQAEISILLILFIVNRILVISFLITAAANRNRHEYILCNTELNCYCTQIPRQHLLFYSTPIHSLNKNKS